MDIRTSIGSAWLELTSEEQCSLSQADFLVQKVALRTAAVVAQTLRTDNVEARPICARKAEKDVLEQAAKELRLLVMKTGDVPHAMDGQIPLTVESGLGLIGIEIKSGYNTISTEEVNKFREDLVMSPFVVGLFVSQRAPISKIPRGIHVHYELSLTGAIPCIFVSPPGQDNMLPLIRNALALACTFAKRNTRQYSNSDIANSGKITEEHKRDLEHLGSLIREEVAALSITRKRLRDEEEVFRKRVDRASDALTATQQRLAMATDNLFSPKSSSVVTEETE